MADAVKKFYKSLPNNKIEIAQNKTPVKMKEFLSFVTVPLEISRDHLGCDMGWTLRINTELNLKITGGFAREDGVEYLDSIQYKENLDNPYNNYVNPFYIFDILTDAGKEFFIKHYEKEIHEYVESLKNKMDKSEDQYRQNVTDWKEVTNEVYKLFFKQPTHEQDPV